MMGRERKATGEFGFARGAEAALNGAQSRPRLVHAKDEQAPPPTPKAAPRSPMKTAPKAPPVPPKQPPIQEADDSGWVVRTKESRPAPNRSLKSAPKAREETSRQNSNPAFVNSGPLNLARAPDTDWSSRRWLALGMAGMVYVVGIAGLWSMLQTFEQPPASPLTPAGDSGTLPPIDEEIDVRDARLDEGVFRPKFKPETPVPSGEDVAASDFQKRI